MESCPLAQSDVAQGRSERARRARTRAGPFVAITLFGVAVAGRSAATENSVSELRAFVASAEARDEPFFDDSRRSLFVPRRAPSVHIARAPGAANARDRSANRFAPLETPPRAHGARRAAPADAAANALPPLGLDVAGIHLGIGNKPQSGFSRDLAEHRGDAAFRMYASDRSATAGGASLASLSQLGWTVGALDVGLGAFLLVTRDRASASGTTVGADLYRGGAGFRIRRAWW